MFVKIGQNFGDTTSPCIPAACNWFRPTAVCMNPIRLWRYAEGQLGDHDMDELQYPIGQFSHKDAVTAADVSGWIDEIAALPQALRAAVAGLDDAQLDTPDKATR